MGGNNWFQFKKFRIEQSQTAMKVGTDGVLLGAWTPVENSHHILDVGTGTGLVSLMLAQRCTANIDAVEMDEQAYKEAKFNFEQSDWSDRLHAVHSDFNDFTEDSNTTYDLIVSNPPFFINSLKSSDPAFCLARHSDTLSFSQLITGAKRRLDCTGRLCVIIPIESCVDFRETARLNGFYLRQKTVVIPKIGKEPKRVLLEFTLNKVYPIDNELIILDRDGSYTNMFKSLTTQYYLAI